MINTTVIRVRSKFSKREFFQYTLQNLDRISELYGDSTIQNDISFCKVIHDREEDMSCPYVLYIQSEGNTLIYKGNLKKIIVVQNLKIERTGIASEK